MSMEQKYKQLLSEEYLERLIAPEEYNEKHKIFFNDDKAKSQILATALLVSQEEFKAVQDWFSLLLQRLCKLEFDNGHIIIDELTICLEKTSANLSLNANKLILAKLIYYNNIIQSGYLQSSVFGIMTKFLNDEIERRMAGADFTFAQFMALSEYLKHNFYVSPNGDLLENLIKIEYQNKARSQRNTFKFKNFIPKNQQGCYLITNKILNLPYFEGKFDLCIKALKWLDSARGKEPSKGWLTKFNELKNELGKEVLQEITNEILKLESLAYHDFGSYSWPDDVMKRFIKSAQWIKELH